MSGCTQYEIASHLGISQPSVFENIKYATRRLQFFAKVQALLPPRKRRRAHVIARLPPKMQAPIDSWISLASTYKAADVAGTYQQRIQYMVTHTSRLEPMIRAVRWAQSPTKCWSNGYPDPHLFVYRKSWRDIPTLPFQ